MRGWSNGWAMSSLPSLQLQKRSRLALLQLGCAQSRHISCFSWCTSMTAPNGQCERHELEPHVICTNTTSCMQVLSAVCGCSAQRNVSGKCTGIFAASLTLSQSFPDIDVSSICICDCSFGQYMHIHSRIATFHKGCSTITHQMAPDRNSALSPDQSSDNAASS